MVQNYGERGPESLQQLLTRVAAINEEASGFRRFLEDTVKAENQGSTGGGALAGHALQVRFPESDAQRHSGDAKCNLWDGRLFLRLVENNYSRYHLKAL